MSDTLRITSVAHPAASACHGHPADLNDAEIASTRLNGLPVYHEHDTHSTPIGTVLTSYQPSRGEDAGALMCESLITDPEAIKRIESGHERGVSLGTELRYDMDGKVVSRVNQELSVCEEGARVGCVTKWMAKNHEPARRVSNMHRASHAKTNGTPHPQSRTTHPLTIRTRVYRLSIGSLTPCSFDDCTMMSEPSEAERKRIADLEAKVLELQEKDAQNAKMLEQNDAIVKSFHEEKRAALDATAPQVQDFFKTLAGDEAAMPYQVEHGKMANWAENMCKDENPSASLHLGRVMVTASVRDKRQRDEIDALKLGSANMSDVAKERDDLRAEVEGLRQKNTGLTEECSTKQTSIEKLSLEMKKYEAVGMQHPSSAMTHQFSQLGERYKPPASMVPNTGVVADQGSSSQSSPSVSEQRPSLLGWVINQTTHMSEDQMMSYRDKNALPSGLM